MSAPSGEQTIVVPQATPVVSFRASDRSLLVPGAHVSLLAREVGGKLTAESANPAGFVLPY